MNRSSGKYAALLLAGGLGTRLRPLTDRIPKCLVPIAGRPLLDYWIDRCEAAGIQDIVINTHHLPEAVREHMAQVNRSRNVHMRESYEPALLGSAGTVRANRELADSADQILIIYADNLSNVRLTDLIRYHASHGNPVTMMLFRTQHPQRCGIARLDERCVVTSFVEKPKHDMGNLANAGLYVLTAAAYREMADMNRFDLAFDVLPSFVGRMNGWVFDGYHMDVGTPESLEMANRDAREIFGLEREERI